MDHWNKGGLSREEFLRMRENALRQLQELARKQQALASAAGNSPQASDTISKKENMPLEQVPVQPVMQPEQIRPAEDKNTIAEPWKETGPKAAQMPDPAVSDVLEQPRDGDSIREREKPVMQPDFGRSSQELPERKQPWQMPLSPQVKGAGIENDTNPPSDIPTFLHSEEPPQQQPLPPIPPADSLQVFSNISRIIENIGFSNEGELQSEPNTERVALERTGEPDLFPDPPGLTAPQEDPSAQKQREQVLPAFAPDDLFPLPEQAAEEPPVQPERIFRPAAPKPQSAPSPDADPWRYEPPKQVPASSRPPYHPDGFVPERPGRGTVFHPDAVSLPKEGHYVPPAPPQKPPFRRRSFWGGENPKKK